MIFAAECNCCTSGFPSLEQLSTVNNNSKLLNDSIHQGIFPTLRFTCDGTLTQLIYRTIAGGAEFGRSELFEFWRVNSINQNISNALEPIPTRETEILFRNISSNTSLYSVYLNISVKADDYMGIGQLVPSTMQYQAVNDSISDYYYRRQLSSLFNVEDEVAEPTKLTA